MKDVRAHMFEFRTPTHHLQVGMHVCPIARRYAAQPLPWKSEMRRVEGGSEEGDGAEVRDVSGADGEAPDSALVAQFEGMKNRHTDAEDGLVKALQSRVQMEAMPPIRTGQ